MAVYNDELYAVGVFDYAGGVPAPGGIARWDGWKWCAINDYFEGRVCSELTAYNGELYTGGGWASISGDTSFNYLARWKGGTFGDTCSVSLSIQNIGSSINSVAIYPNPATDIIHIGVTGSCTVALIDELGKLVYCAPYAPKGIDISRLGKGMYIVKVICREEVRIGKLIKTD
jgi:hypothetical protein